MEASYFVTVGKELNRLVEALGLRLRRNVSVDDSRFRQLAFSSHEFGVVDEMRLQSILMREVPKGAAEWSLGAGASSAEAPFRPPIAPEIGVTAQRMCVPIRLQGNLLGYLWVLEGDEPLDDGELQSVMAATETIGVIIHRDMLADALDRSHARELVRELVGDDAASRRHAAADLLDRDLFVGDESIVAMVVTIHDKDRSLSDIERSLLTANLERLCRRMSGRRAISLVLRGHGLVMLSDEDPMVKGSSKQALAAELVDRLQREFEGGSPHVGIGSPAAELTDFHISYTQAQRAAQVARVIPGLGAVARSSDLGVYGMLARLPEGELRDEPLGASLEKLLGGGEKGEQLATTLETFLDNAGDVQRTASELYVHRTTLYYRLQRIEELTGADLADGNDRLALHLGLKLARLTGRRREAGT